MTYNAPARQSTVLDIIEEYERKIENVDAAIKAYEDACTAVEMAGTIMGTYVNPVLRGRAPRTGNSDHPTQKPVELMEQVVLWTDGVVFDPFMGSGSTGIACARLGRAFVGVELDPAYFDTACRAIERAIGSPSMFKPKPVNDNVPTASLFDEVAA